MSQPAETDVTTRQQEPLWVVGIGAGAGGLEAIQLLFGAMPVDRKLAFIICRHVQSGLSDPLADLLCTQTPMPVVQAENGMMIEAGRIHLVAPNARMILLKDRLVIFDKDENEETEPEVSPIDILLHSLAASSGSNAIAVMLSGKDRDGLRGCASIRHHGGLVLAQHPESTEFAEMPHRVIEADLASAIAPPGALADLISRHVGKAEMPDLPRDGGTRDEEALSRIIALLETRLSIDAHAYRPSLVAKRVRRRLAMSKAATLADYADLLAADDHELSALHDDLLIRVTAFFRDPEAFAALEQSVLPTLLEGMSKDHPIRVWVPASATGEEPYSLAMLFLDHSARAGKEPHVEIIASDRHVPSIEKGRRGRYSEDHLSNIPAGLIERFMEDDGEGLVISPSLRRHVTFIEHDMLKTPPPDNIDLVSCRNLLIYLATASRKKALQACHEALKPGGFLFLGPSEQPGGQMADLGTVHGKWRIYRKAPEPPIDRALTKLAAAKRQAPAEPILPGEGYEPVEADPSVPLLEPPNPETDRFEDMNHVLMDNQRMLESTIDTLLSSNDRLRRRNRDLRTENQRLLHAHAALDDVATMIAHDLKMPLAAVERLSGRLHEVLSADANSRDALRWLKPMQHRLAALHQIIDDLLAYAREGPADKADLRPVDFADLLRETLTLIGLPGGVRVVIKPPSLRLLTWRIPLACIFRNLLGQAIERIGSASGTIRIDATPARRSLDIAVIDDGKETPDRASELGLAVVEQLLEAAGGKLTSTANPAGTGQQVHFTWPIEGHSFPESVEKTSSSA